MNERIRQIAEDCGIYVPQFDDNNPEVIKLERFARAIAQTCLDELECSRIGDPYTGRLYECERNTVLDDQIDWLRDYFIAD